MTDPAARTDQSASAPERPRRVLYGRRSGHKLSERQRQLLTTLLPRLTVPGEGALDPAALFGPGVTRVALEIGAGGGEHALAQLAGDPGLGLIAAEPFINGVAKLLAGLPEDAAPRLRVHMDDARDVLARIRPACLDAAFILFPDPWPKARHAKRRMFARGVLAALARALGPGAELRLASDQAFYIAWALEEAEADGHFALSALTTTRPADWPSTRYELKALRAGRDCQYLSFRRLAPA